MVSDDAIYSTVAPHGKKKKKLHFSLILQKQIKSNESNGLGRWYRDWGTCLISMDPNLSLQEP